MKKTDISALEHKWRSDSPDNPPCAICDRIIEGVGPDGEEEIAIRTWRRRGPVNQELAFHPECFRCLNVTLSDKAL